MGMSREVIESDRERARLASLWANAPLTHALIGCCWDALAKVLDPEVRDSLEASILFLHAYADRGREASEERRSEVRMLIDYAEKECQ